MLAVWWLRLARSRGWLAVGRRLLILGRLTVSLLRLLLILGRLAVCRLRLGRLAGLRLPLLLGRLAGLLLRRFPALWLVGIVYWWLTHGYIITQSSAMSIDFLS